jgi:hypothetical protein
MKQTLILFILCILAFIISGCSRNRPGVVNCETNVECPQSYKCQNGNCVDIYYPYLGGPKGV